MATKPQVEPTKTAEAATPAPVVAPVKAEAAKPQTPVPAPKPATPEKAPAVVAKAEAKPVPPVKAKPAPKARIVKKKPVAKAAAVKTAPVKKLVKAPVALAKKETKVMQDTIKKTTAETTERAKAMFGDINARTKDAVAKSTKAFEEMNEFTKGNIEALVASSKIAAKGAEDIAKYSAEYGRKAIADTTENAKKFAAVKSPTEFFQLQSELVKSSIDAMVSESSKFTENYLKLMGEVSQPISNRVAVAVEKVKIAA
ncbi:MAG: TIGR01841 family phasin [Phycisphaerales bacterium]|jgi:phasin family protein